MNVTLLQLITYFDKSIATWIDFQITVSVLLIFKIKSVVPIGLHNDIEHCLM